MNEQKEIVINKNPWSWIPTLYIAQGFPYSTVNEMGNLFFKALGVPNEILGIISGFFVMPWAFKFIWSPLVDLAGKKRNWILTMQGLLTAALLAIAFFVAKPVASGSFSLQLFMPDMANSWAMSAFTIGILLLMFSVGFGMDAMRRPSTRLFCAILFLVIVLIFAKFNSWMFKSETFTLLANIWLFFGIFLVMAFFSATHDIAIDGYYLDVLDIKNQQNFSGVRVMFYRIAMVIGGGLLVMLAGKFNNWTLAFGIGAVLFSAIFIYHFFLLPISDVDSRSTEKGSREGKTFANAFSTYLDQNKIILIILFILFFRIGDFLWKPMSKPFLMDIGVSVAQIGFLQGVVGIIATIAGSILGGMYIAKRGLTRGLWALGIIQNVTLLLYAYLAVVHKIVPKGNPIGMAGLVHVAVINTFENFAYGLGTIAFVNFLMRTCKKEYNAAHYAIASGLMGIAVMFAGFFSGFLQHSMGYTVFFVFCFVASTPGLLLLYFLPLQSMENAN